MPTLFSKNKAFIIPGHCIAIQADKSYNMMHVHYCDDGAARNYHIFQKTQTEGKAIPLPKWTDPEGSRRKRFPDFKTMGT